FLRRAVALADRHSMIIERIEVDRDAVRRADLFLSTVTLTDGTGVVEIHIPVFTQRFRDGASLRSQFRVTRQRQYRHLVRRQSRVELQYRTLVHTTLGVGHLVLGVGVE